MLILCESTLQYLNEKDFQICFTIKGPCWKYSRLYSFEFQDWVLHSEICFFASGCFAISGQRAQHISASPTGESDLDGLRVRFASVQQTLQSGQISEQCEHGKT